MRTRAIMLAAVLCGCAPEAPEWAGERVQHGSVEVVHNPAEPMAAAESIIPVELWTAGEVGVTDSILWESPSAIRLDAGHLIVLDGMASRFHVLNESGRVLGSYGRKGSGPGELERPFGIAVHDQEIVIGDGGKASLERFSAAGDYRGSVHIGRVGFGLEPLGGQYLVNALLGSEGGWIRVDTVGAAVPFEWPDTTYAPDASESDCTRVSTGHEHVLRLDCHVLAYQVLDHQGRTVREVVVDRPSQPVEPQKLEEHLSNVRRIMGESGMPAALIESQVERERARLALNPLIRMARSNRSDARVAVLEQDIDDLGSGPATIHIFSATGVYLAEVAFEESWVDFAWSGSRLYALARDPETDVVRMKAYEVDVPDS